MKKLLLSTLISLSSLTMFAIPTFANEIQLEELKESKATNTYTIQIESSHKPLSGQSSRSSENMPVLPTRDNYSFKVYETKYIDGKPEYVENNDISFNIKYDKSLSTDPYVAKNVKNDTVLHYLDHHDSLYIARISNI